MSAEPTPIERSPSIVQTHLPPVILICGTRSRYLAGAREVQRSRGSLMWVSTSITLTPANGDLLASGLLIRSVSMRRVFRFLEGADDASALGPGAAGEAGPFAKYHTSSCSNATSRSTLEGSRTAAADREDRRSMRRPRCPQSSRRATAPRL